MTWIVLCIAGLCEIGWAVGMKYSEGFTRPLATVITIALIVLSLSLLNLALRTLPLGTAYGIWTGIGTAGTALVGNEEWMSSLSGIALPQLVSSGIVS